MAVLGVAELGVAELGAVAVGDSREAVVRELGERGASIVVGDREVLTYAGVAKLRLERGVVVAVEQLAPVAATEQTPPLTMEEFTTRAQAAREQAEQRHRDWKQRESERRRREFEEVKQQEAALAEVRATTAARVESFGGRRNGAGSPPSAGAATQPRNEASPAAAEEVVSALVLGLVLLGIQTGIYFLATLVVLVPVCRYWEVDMFASGYLLSSLANAVVLALVLLVIAILVPLRLSGGTQMLIASIFTVPTLVGALHRFSFNQDLGASVRVAFLANGCSFAVMIGANATLKGVALALATQA